MEKIYENIPSKSEDAIYSKNIRNFEKKITRAKMS